MLAFSLSYGAMRWLQSAFRWGWDNIGNIAVAAVGLMSFGLPAWALRTADLFAAYAPFSWVLAGFAGLFIAALIFFIYASARLLITTYRAKEHWLKSVDRINPLESTFKNQRIKIVDLVSPISNVVMGKTFLDCELIGPANIGWQSTQFNRVKLSKVDAIVHKEEAKLTNIIYFLNCNIVGGTLHGVTITRNMLMAF